MTTKWLLHEPSAEAAARLFCLPYSGCGASMYRRWPRRVGGVEVCAVQPPGRENRFREEPYPTYEAMADDLAEALLPYLDRPFAFFGHCASALPGYETALRLAERGHPVPVRLFVSSQVAPHQGPHGRFLRMSDEELAVELRDLVVRLGGSPRPDLIELSLTVLRADVEANKRYRPPRPRRLPCPVTTLGWTEDHEVDHRLMDGWAECGEVTKRLLDGPHYGFLDAPEELLAAFVEDMKVT
ncbi:thioesterase II family protein [Streptantibioticus cattleyicolor]|uniref:Thioesterase II n=1 Tax=Streptantibioticus cattleyicolor (strain ATCC 35852 / DSM 46488 / JCM 4925 / NBRC 14057 / NRRL 8057) TaxID=1003195 RepID=F8JMK2_STREN|nr:thioesterase domain-containing protein [Streptantibioticus cattleyicolor]AEW99315.1 thioesterase II [Streptantibioticus cattleyicolor NRRL 8057 = DSM 46488]CCB71646.1 Thioesterase II [Streptantibioticus cattleyicolor NRRL 8057 = DSM 46488]